MRPFLTVLMIVPLALLWLGFSMINAGGVEIDYYFGVVALPLSILLAIVMGVGMLLGGGAGLSNYLSMRREINELRAQVKIRDEEVVNLRSIPIKDGP